MIWSCHRTRWLSRQQRGRKRQYIFTLALPFGHARLKAQKPKPAWPARQISTVRRLRELPA